MSILYILDLLGTFVFAISGTMAAAERRLDFFGAAVIGFITATGGGTIRDVLIGSTPVVWMRDTTYLLCIVGGILCAFLFQRAVLRLRGTLFLFDTIGLGVFTVLGLQKALQFELSISIAIMMGTVSAVFGGVLRDVLVNEIPLIFRKEVYATACLAGGCGYFILAFAGVDQQVLLFATPALVIAVRILSIRFHWEVPVLRMRK